MRRYKITIPDWSLRNKTNQQQIVKKPTKTGYSPVKKKSVHKI